MGPKRLTRAETEVFEGWGFILSMTGTVRSSSRGGGASNLDFSKLILAV
jgi:hypothetical protein